MVYRARVYVETSIVSYLTSRPSRDLLVAAHQQVTRDWWDSRASFDLFASQVVLEEAAAGDSAVAERRVSALREVGLLLVTLEATQLSSDLVRHGGLPAKARVDALHIAIASVNGMEFLLTWNCRHIANAATRPKIEMLCRSAGFEPPVICTPLELSKE
jgi:hypothetical protein